jgi:Mn-dependent DtxR family transcriptional regulator
MTVSFPDSLLYDRTLSTNALRYYDVVRKEPSLSVGMVAERLGVTLNAAYKLERTLVRRGYFTVVKVRDAKGIRSIREFCDKERAS